MYKVFYNQRTVYFTENDKNYNESGDSKIHYFKNKILLKKELNRFTENQELNNLFIVHKNIESIFKEFSSYFQIIEAAGGLVKNENEEILVIYRRNVWDLPKGKIEKNEQPDMAAIREVEEECGISNIEISNLLEITYHTYKLNEKEILKKTFWYKMCYGGNQKLIPQTEEEITEVKWLKKENLQEITDNTFPSIIQVLKKGELI